MAHRAWLGLVVVALCASTVCAQNLQNLTLAAGGCSALEFDNLGNKFSYTATLNSLALPANCTTISVSKLYLQDTCLSTRDNSFELSTKAITCDAATNGDPSVCSRAFSEGPANAILTGTALTVGGQIDSGDICWEATKSFIYVQNNCTDTVTISATVTNTSYQGSLCVKVGGHALGTWAIIGIIIAAVVVLGLLFLLVCCCCCL